MESVVTIDRHIAVSNKLPLVIFGGINVIEDLDSTLYAAEMFKRSCDRLGLALVFKASFDKANRSSIHSFRGPGMDAGLKILQRVRQETGLALVTDIHESEQAEAVAEVVQVLQIPAFLARQTDLMVAAASTKVPIHIKKPQYMSPSQMKYVAEKARQVGNTDVLVCDRGTQFGYDNLVVDMLGFRQMHEACYGAPVIFDVTHSLQRRDSDSAASGGRRRQALELARAATGAGIAGLFIEAHSDPDRAMCDGPSAIRLDVVEPFLRQVAAIDSLVKGVEDLELE